MGVHWQTCPLGELRNPMWLAAVQTAHLAEISPLSGWPDTYNACVVDVILALRQARVEAARVQQAEFMSGLGRR